MTFEENDIIRHWSHGLGRVVEVPEEIEDVPIEWQHDWTSVIHCEFFAPNGDPNGESEDDWMSVWVLKIDVDR